MSEVAMSNVAYVPTLPGSKVRCRETDEELVFYIPPRPVIGWIAAVLITAVFLACLGFLGFVVYQAGWFVLPFALFVGAIGFIVLGFFFLAFTQRYLTKTFVDVTRERLVLRTVLWGREDLVRHRLGEQSFARLYWGDPSVRRRSEHILKTPQGVQIVLENPKDDSSPVFGDGLSWGEQEWIVWRINRFLGRATDEDAPEGTQTTAETTALIAIEGLPEEPLPPPDGIEVRIDEGVFETDFVFPNTMEMGTRKGIETLIVGAAIAAFVFFRIIQTLAVRGGVDDFAGLIVMGAFGLIGLLVLLMGLLRLFGRSRLTITPEKVTFRTTFFGIGPWASVPTAEILSVKQDAIRTAKKRIRYADQLRDAVRTESERDWLIGEIALRIHAARKGTAAPSIRHRRERPRRRLKTGGNQPTGAVPYDIHRRPLPCGNDVNTLLPVRVGPFRRQEFDEPEAADSGPINVQYHSDEGEVFVELAVCGDSDDARKAVITAETEASQSGAVDEFSPNTEPSFYRMTAPSGAFMAWSRGNYFFFASVCGRNSEQALDGFMDAFPY